MIRKLIAIVLTTLALGAMAATDVNQASRAELESVKGIGPGLSGKILEARKAGAFKNWGDLVERVGGIGAGSAARLSQAGLTVSGSAFDGASATAKAPKERKAMKAGAEGGEAAEKPARARKSAT